MNHTRTASLAAVAILSLVLHGGCARRPAPRDLLAIPHPQGKIRLTWVTDADDGGDAEGIVVQRKTPDGPWRVVATTESPQEPPFVDDVGAVRQPFSYRVATRRGGRLSDWSAPASSLPTYEGKPFWGWLNVADYNTCSISGVASPQAIQCAIQDLGGRTDDHTASTGPHVLYFPNGRYDVSNTLFVEGRAGVQFVGESSGGVVLRWTGRRGTSPDAATVMFHAEGNRDSTFRNFVWDGGCDDPDQCFVVAFDQSFCGRPNSTIFRGDDCSSAKLGWPENPTFGVADNGGAHFDSVFRNAYVGLRLGHHGVADDSSTLRRLSFVDNFAGVSLEDFNALHHWFWDSTFQRNYVGVTNDLSAVRRTFDRDYKPGRCEGQPGQPACYENPDCDSGVRCVLPTGWGGDFAVHRGRFIDNRHTDIWAQPVGEYIVRDSWSTGAGRFFFAAGPNANRGSYSLIGNTVWGGAAPTLVTRGPGPFLLLDNRLFTQGDGPALTADALVGWDAAHPESGTIDMVSVGNLFTTARPYDFRTRHRLRESQRRVATVAEQETIPPPPRVDDPLNGRPVYTVTDAQRADGVANARRIQSIIDAALRDPRPAIVHFPSSGGRFEIAETLRIPEDAELTLVGDGAFTTLSWVGPPGLPALEIDAASARGITVRDLQFLRAGVVVKNLDEQAGRVLLSQMRLDQNDVAGLVLQELDDVRVDAVDYKTGFGVLSQGDNVVGTVVDVGRRATSPRGIAFWSGDTGRNWTDYMVLNDRAGAKLLVTGNYMERSRHHLSIVGNGAGGQVTFLGGKMAPEVPLNDPGDPEELMRATATVSVEDFAGSLGLLQSQMFVVKSGQAGSHPAAVDYGAHIRVIGSRPLDLDLTAVGLAVRRQPAEGDPGEPAADDPEYDFSAAGPNRVNYLRLAGERSIPNALPLPDIQIATAGRVRRVGPSLAPAEGRRFLRSFDLVRALELPGFYDEVGTEAPTIRFDKVFVYKAQTAMVLSAGTPCLTVEDCDGSRGADGIRCDREGIPEGIPGRCRARASAVSQ